MTIGIDVSALQGAHRMRGIGYTVLNFINHIPDQARADHKFVLFLHDDNKDDVLNVLNLDGLDFEVRLIQKRVPERTVSRSTGGRLERLITSIGGQSKELKDRYLGSGVFGDMRGIDCFIQPDQSQTLPKGSRLKKVLILYDIIPYVLEWEYLWSYETARMHNLPRLSSFRCAARRWAYIKKLKVNARRADVLLPISHATKSDFENYVNVPAHKMQVVHLGVSDNKAAADDISLQRYHKTSWGYMSKPFKMDTSSTPFILYVGGADPRRRLDDLVAAYNCLRAEGQVINLVLTGDTMQGPDNIPTPKINQALNNSSYLNEIIFLGFVPDETREILYKQALAFVYPSKYEGFGLPILEAMNHGTPVITYKNSSIPEVGGNAVIYADDYTGIADAVKELLGSSATKKKYSSLGLKQATKFSWESSAKNIISALE